jgi:acetyltransferase-like isoleucine patch superfamily enzyme
MECEMKFNGRNISISPKAQLGRNVKIGDNATIYDGVEVGDDSIICNDAVLGEPVSDYYENPDYSNPTTVIGAGALIRSHTIIYAGCEIGEGLSTGHGACIREYTMIGKHCLVGANCFLMGKLRLGNYCRLHSFIGIAQNWSLGDFVFIYPFVTMTDDPWPPSNDTVAGSIGNYSQVATHAVLLPGVHIGENCLIGAHSMVSKNIPSFSLAVGNPARVLMDIRKYTAGGKENLYPWMTRFDRGMPWSGIGFEAWSQQNRIDDQIAFQFDRGIVGQDDVTTAQLHSSLQ